MFTDGRYKGCFNGGGEGVISYIKRKLELNPKWWGIGHVEKEERVLQIQDLEVRNKEGDRAVFITGEMRVEGPVGGPVLEAWEAMLQVGGWLDVTGEKSRTTLDFWLKDWVDGSANKRRAVDSSGDMYN